jgi:hypothetical protein
MFKATFTKALYLAVDAAILLREVCEVLQGEHRHLMKQVLGVPPGLLRSHDL